MNLRLRTDFQSGLQGKLDVVFDAIYGPYFTPAWNALIPGGRHVLFGAADYMSSCSDRPNWLKLGMLV